MPRLDRIAQHVWASIFHAIAAFVLGAAMPAFAQATDARGDIIGKWKLTSLLDLIDITSRDRKDAQSLLGHVMFIENDGARLDDYRCAPSAFETRKVEPKLYIQEYAGIDARKLRLPNPVTVIDISCTQVFIKSPNRIVIFWDGWFFEARRSVD